MASIGMIQMVLVLGLLTMPWIGAQAQSGCSNVLLSMAPCLNYVTGSSPTPSSSCCSKLASVVQSQPQCLCTALGGGGSTLGININQTLAKALPGACKVQTPPVSKCGAVNGPATSPVGSPQSSEETPGSPTSSEGTADSPTSSEGTAYSPTSSEGTADSPTSSEGTADSPTSSSVSGSKAVPSNSMASYSDGNAIAMPLQFVTVLLFVASYASISSSF